MGTQYVVVDAPGCYGDSTTVLSAHETAIAAIRRAKRAGSRYVARKSTHRAGDRWLRVYDQTSPVVS